MKHPVAAHEPTLRAPHTSCCAAERCPEDRVGRQPVARGPDAAQLEEKREEDMQEEARQARRSRGDGSDQAEVFTKSPDQHDQAEACPRSTSQACRSEPQAANPGSSNAGS